MSRASVFRKADVDRAISVVKAAGLRVAAVEIRPDGTIRVVTEEPEALTAGRGRERNGWDYS